MPASAQGNIREINKFCEWVKNPNLEERNLAPIHEAARHGHGHAIRVLVQYGALVNAVWVQAEKRSSTTTSSSGRRTTHSYTVYHHHTPLQLAYLCGSQDAVRALLEAGANPNNEFVKACESAEIHMIKIFLELAPSCSVNKGFEYYIQNHFFHKTSISCARLFLQYGANPNRTYNKGKSLLYRSVQEGDIEFVRLLCEFGGDLEIQSTKGKTPLYVAIKGTIKKVKRIEMVRVLCELGANIYALGPKNKKTIFEHARGKLKIFEVLELYA